jgi:hypothetical protein
VTEPFSYFKVIYPTFARTTPSANFVSKSLESLLLNYNWTHTALSFSSSTEYIGVSEAVISLFKQNNINIVHQKAFDFCHFSRRSPMRNSFFDWINETKNDARIFIILGELDCHLGLLKAFYDHGLFTDNSEDEYFVIGVNIDVYDESGMPIENLDSVFE